jgi:hypothetical protein
MQADSFGWLAAEMYRIPRENCLRWARLLGVDNALTKALELRSSAEASLFAGAYWTLAARYRFERDDQQRDLFDDRDYHAEHVWDWPAFYRDTVQRLTEEDDGFVMAALAAGAYGPDNAIGVAGVLRLEALLAARLGNFDRAYEAWLRTSYADAGGSQDRTSDAGSSTPSTHPEET